MPPAETMLHITAQDSICRVRQTVELGAIGHPMHCSSAGVRATRQTVEETVSFVEANLNSKKFLTSS